MVLSQTRSGFQTLSGSLILKFWSSSPGIYAIQNRVCQKWSARVLKWREKGLSSWYAQCLLTYTFESVDEILKCDHSNESNWAELSCGTVYYAVQGGSYFCVCGWNPQVWPFKWKQLSSTFQPYYLYTIQSCSYFCLVDDILNVWPFKWKLLSISFFPVVVLLRCTRWL